MKRIALLLVIAIILVSFVGCTANDGGDAESTPAPSAHAMDAAEIATEAADAFILPETTPEASPTLEPEQTPVPDYKPSEYTYNTIDIAELALSVTYPSFYDIAYTTNTVTFTQPVSDDRIPIRFAISVKEYTSMNLSIARKEIRDFKNVLANRYDRFKASKPVNNILFMNRSALHFTYQATQNDRKVSGLVIMTSVTGNKKVYALHFSTPAKRYSDLQSVFKKVMYSCTPIY